MKLTSRMVAALKRTAQNNYPLQAKKEKLMAKINTLNEEISLINVTIDGMEAGSKALTGGFTSFDLIERVVTGTGKYGEDGKEIKLTKYVPKAGALQANEDGSYEVLISKDAPLPLDYQDNATAVATASLDDNMFDVD